MSKKTLYIVRGISGSGKTTFAKELAEREHCFYFEADMYFERVDGAYTFNPAKLPQAHEWCLAEVCAEIRSGRSVIVSNTFTREWEMQEYIRCALLHDYTVRVITCTGQYQNVHGLTEREVARQVARFQSNEEIKAANSRYDIPNVIFSNH
jgi:predicted kinase